jgi:RND superfamily putative drug exporter
MPGLASVAPPTYNQAGNAAVIIADPTTSPQAGATASLVRQLRSSVVPSVVGRAPVSVYGGGVTAAAVDSAQYLSHRMPWVMALVILLASLLLMAVFRSVAIPSRRRR